MTGWMRSASAFADLLEGAAAAMRASPLREGSVVRLPRRGRLLVTGDIHDNPLHYDAVVRAAELGRSPDNHLVLHELIHGERLMGGVDMSHRMLARVAELVLRFPQQVHPILANHEIAQYRGQHISKGAGDNLELFDAGLDWVYGDEAEVAAAAIGAFVAAMPIAIRCENGAFVSHSLPAESQYARFDQTVFARELVEADFDGPTGAAYLMTWGRGHSAAHLERLGREWGVRLFLSGHAHAPDGVDYRPPNQLILNTDHDQGRFLELDLAADAPEAKTLLSRALPVRSYVDLALLGGADA